jgi:hypothetical protein
MTAATLSFGETITYVAISVVSIGLAVWAIVDMYRRPPTVLPTSRRTAWMLGMLIPSIFLIFALAGVIAVIYLLAERPGLAARQRSQADAHSGSSGGTLLLGSGAAPGAPASAPTGIGALARPSDIPFGWYHAPSGQAHERWWDGVGWTGFVRS